VAGQGSRGCRARRERGRARAAGQGRRLIEERRNGHLDKAARAVAAATAEVDKLAPKYYSVLPSNTHWETQSTVPRSASFS
jgi:hypothetical protein